MQKSVLAIVLTLIILSTGCVSKKKYNELVNSKARSDQKVKELNNQTKELESQLSTKTKEAKSISEQLDKLKAEYNEIKNQLMESNAKKSTSIDELNKKLANLSTDKNVLKDSLQSAIKRMNKKEESFNRKQTELAVKLAEIEKLEKALLAYNNSLTELENVLKESFSKYNIVGCYILRQKGNLYITFDDMVLFINDDTKMADNGKKAIKVIAAALEKRPNINIKIGSNWNSSLVDTKAWEKTKVRGNTITEYMMLNGDIKINRFGITGRQIQEQMVPTDKEIATCLILSPTTETLLSED